MLGALPLLAAAGVRHLWSTPVAASVVPAADVDPAEVEREVLSLYGAYLKAGGAAAATRGPGGEVVPSNNDFFLWQGEPGGVADKRMQGGVWPRLREQLAQRSTDYVRRTAQQTVPPAADRVRMWATVQVNGSLHEPHTHPNVTHSGVYYATGGAALEFWDPRSGSWPPFDGRVEAVPEPGTVVCFPNWEVHGVVRTHSVTPRVSVAFNVAHPPDHHEAPGATSLFTTSHVSAGDRPVLSSTLPSSGVAHLWATPVLREHVRLEEKSLVASIEAAASSLLDSSSCVVRVTALPDYRSQQSVLGSPRPRGAALHGYYRHPVPTESSPPPPVVQMYDPRSAGYRDTTFLGQLVWHARPGELMLCPGWVPWEVLPPRDYRTGRAPPMRGAAGRHSGQWVSVVSREPAEDSVVVCSGAEEGAMLSLGRGGERRLNASAAPPPSLALVEVACPDGWALADAHRAASSAVHADGPQGIGSRDVERQGGGALGDAVRAVLTRWDNDRDGVWSLSEARAASRNGMAAGKWGVEGLCTPASDLWPELTCIVTLRDLQGWYSRHQQALAGDRQVSRATTVFALAFA